IREQGGGDEVDMHRLLRAGVDADAERLEAATKRKLAIAGAAIVAGDVQVVLAGVIDGGSEGAEAGLRDVLADRALQAAPVKSITRDGERADESDITPRGAREERDRAEPEWRLHAGNVCGRVARERPLRNLQRFFAHHLSGISGRLLTLALNE